MDLPYTIQRLRKIKSEYTAGILTCKFKNPALLRRGNGELLVFFNFSAVKQILEFRYNQPSKLQDFAAFKKCKIGLIYMVKNHRYCCINFEVSEAFVMAIMFTRVSSLAEKNFHLLQLLQVL